MGTLRFLGIIVSFKIGRTFRFADYMRLWNNLATKYRMKPTLET